MRLHVLSNLRRIFDDAPWLAKLLGGSVLVGGVVLLLRHRSRKATGRSLCIQTLVWLLSISGVQVIINDQVHEQHTTSKGDNYCTGYKHQPRKEYPKDTVVFHHFRKGQNTPSWIPFAVKLETYFRMAKIPYETVLSPTMSTKHKFPWIEYNDETVADSEFCIQFLNKERGVNLNSHLTPEQEGAGRAFQKMFEENTYWIVALDRWWLDETNGFQKTLNVSWFVSRSIRNLIRKQTYCQGIGRHSKEEILHILRLDLSSLSKYLGSKKFLFGDQASQYDCAIFGLLAVGLWDGFGGYVPKIIKEHPNICKYCENMRNEFWPDWDECTLKGEKTKVQQ